MNNEAVNIRLLAGISHKGRKGGALAPPVQGLTIIPLSRGAHSPSADGLCAPRDATAGEVAPAAGLKPRPSRPQAKTEEAGEKSRLAVTLLAVYSGSGAFVPGAGRRDDIDATAVTTE